ncbi:hypothetical protein LINPERPRIM_LOCUS19086 [Linum perenne]
MRQSSRQTLLPQLPQPDPRRQTVGGPRGSRQDSPRRRPRSGQRDTAVREVSSGTNYRCEASRQVQDVLRTVQRRQQVDFESQGFFCRRRLRDGGDSRDGGTDIFGYL